MDIQSVFNKSGTSYNILSDLNLEGNSIEIPENCTLYFNGGSISNGTVIGTNTLLVGSNLGTDVTYDGTWIENTSNDTITTDKVYDQDSSQYQNELNAAFMQLFFDVIQDYEQAIDEAVGDLQESISSLETSIQSVAYTFVEEIEDIQNDIKEIKEEIESLKSNP